MLSDPSDPILRRRRRAGAGPMRWVDVLHRWAGGLIGLLLAVIGLSGAMLLHKDTYLRLMLPHAADARVADPALLGAATQRLFAGPEAPTSIVFATDRFGLDKLSFPDRSGAYADQAGHIVARWSSPTERPELWLVELHRFLFSGKTGEAVVGSAGLAGIGFVLTGILLWWRTRRTFRFRLLPKRLSRPAIVTWHRDLGIVAAPLLLLSMVSGAMMVFPSVTDFVLRPLAKPGAIAASLAPPKTKGGALDRAALDWPAMVEKAHALCPDAELRVISLPRKPGDLVSFRLRQPAEWDVNGRTLVWFDPSDGHLVAARDALTQGPGPRTYDAVRPLHTAWAGGLLWRLVMTLSGLSLALLGSLAVWTFWFRRR